MIRIARLIPFFSDQYEGSFNPIIELTNKLKNFFSTFLLHNSRGFVWGLGLLFLGKRYCFKKAIN